MRTQRNLIFFSFALFCMHALTAELHAVNYTWTGATSSAWGTASNWNPSGVPGTGDQVTIVSASNAPALSGNTTVANFLMTSGQLTLNGYTMEATAIINITGGHVTTGRIYMYNNTTTSGVGTTILDAQVDAIVDVHCPRLTLRRSVFADSCLISKHSTADAFVHGLVAHGHFDLILDGGNAVLGETNEPDTFLSSMAMYLNSSAIVTLARYSAGHLFAGPTTFSIGGSGSGGTFNIGNWQASTSVKFLDTLTLSSTRTGSSFYFYPQCTTTFDDGAGISIGSAGMATGTIRLFNVHMSETSFLDLNDLGTAAWLRTDNGSTFGQDVHLDGFNIVLAATTFYGDLKVDNSTSFTMNTSQVHGKADLEDVSQLTGSVLHGTARLTSRTRSVSSTSNKYLDTLTIINSAVHAVGLSQVHPDTSGTVIIHNDSTGSVRLSSSVSGGIIAGNLHLHSRTGSISTSKKVTVQGDIFLDMGTGLFNTPGVSWGTTYHENGSIIVLPGGYNGTSLSLANYHHSGSGTFDLREVAPTTAIHIVQGSTIDADVLIDSAASATLTSSTFNGDVSVVAASVAVGSSTFNGTTSLTKTGNGNNWNSGNTFNGATTLGRNSSVGAFTFNCAFNSDLLIDNQSTASIYIGGGSVLKGDLTVQGASSAVVYFGESTSLRTRFMGSEAQTVTLQPGVNTQFLWSKVDKAGGSIMVDGTMDVVSGLTLTKGHIRTTGGSVVRVRDNATVTGASDSSHVAGAVLKVGNDAFIFPVGRNGRYRPIGMSAPSSGSAEFRGEYFEHSADSDFPLNSRETSLVGISSNEFWTLERLASTSNVSVTLAWDSITSCTMDTTITAVRVAGWDGTEWADLGNGGTTGTLGHGTVVSAAAVSDFHAFTLGHGTEGMGCNDCNSAVCHTLDSMCFTTPINNGEGLYSFIATADTMFFEITDLTALITSIGIYQNCRDEIAVSNVVFSEADGNHIIGLYSNGLVEANRYYLRLVTDDFLLEELEICVSKTLHSTCKRNTPIFGDVVKDLVW